MKTFKFVLVGVLAAACGGGGGGNDRPDGRRVDGIVVADGSGGGGDGGGTTFTCEPSYTTGAQPSAVFIANYDDNGDTAGDPIANNDVMSYAALVKQGAAAGDPIDILFVNLFEGYGVFKGKAEGSVVDFASFTLPLAIDLSDPVEANADDCGACLSIWGGATVSGGQITGLAAILAATSGTMNITSLPSAVDQTFTATLTGVGFQELDPDAEAATILPGGCSSTIASLEATAPAEAPGKPGEVQVRFFPVIHKGKHGRF